ncbi:MAG: PRC-barrel domain-containing protein [Chloroflexota bacterium]|jgi:sporulation protein YlmC with PRC-barrel domain
MRVAQELMNKPVISVNEGREVGKVQGFCIDQNLTHLVAISLGSEGLLSRKETLIKWPDVVTLGQDAILVKDANSVMEKDEIEDFENLMRRDEIKGRSIDTPGGTKIGRIGDIILDDKAMIAGFALSQTHVSGPIADNRAINRKAVIDLGNQDGAMTIDLSEAEKADLQIVHEGFFAEPSVSPNQSVEATSKAA